MENFTWHLRAIIEKCGKGRSMLLTWKGLRVCMVYKSVADQGKSSSATESARTIASIRNDDAKLVCYKDQC